MALARVSDAGQLMTAPGTGLKAASWTGEGFLGEHEPEVPRMEHKSVQLGDREDPDYVITVGDWVYVTPGERSDWCEMGVILALWEDPPYKGKLKDMGYDIRWVWRPQQILHGLPADRHPRNCSPFPPKSRWFSPLLYCYVSSRIALYRVVFSDTVFFGIFPSEYIVL